MLGGLTMSVREGILVTRSLPGLALSGLGVPACRCPLLGQKRTWVRIARGRLLTHIGHSATCPVPAFPFTPLRARTKFPLLIPSLCVV